MNRSSLLILALSFASVQSNVLAQGSLSLCDCSAFFLTEIGQVTTNPSEVISGSHSIKGSYSGSGNFTPYLRSKPALSLVPFNTYRITFRYRILVTPSRGFDTLFFSPTGGNAGNFLPSTTITGNAGDSGTQTLTNTLGQYSDYEARWNVVGTGAISIDDIQIVNVTTGQTVTTEDTELIESPMLDLKPVSGLLAPGSNSVAISFKTTQATNCGYSVGTPLSFNSMTPLDSGSPKNVHQGTVSGLSSDTRVLSHVYIRCTSNPDYVQSVVYRTVAAPSGAFPRIGNIWIGNYLYQNKPEQAKKVQLYLGPNLMSAADANTLRAANPDILILPSIQLDDAFDLTLPESYYLHDTTGNRISDWPGSYIYNMTRPEVATYVGTQAYQFLAQSNWAFDGIFFDSFGTSKAVNMIDASGKSVRIDADGDGLPDDQGRLNAAWAAGEYLAVSTYHSMAPGGYVSGHVGERPPQTASLAAFNGTSIAFDPVNVRERTMPFDTLWNLYQTWEAQASSPAMTMVQSSPPNQLAYGYGYYPLKALLPATAIFAQTFYPNMRFGLALTLMNDGFFTHDFGDTGYASPLTWWYDEYDFNLGYPLGPAAQIRAQSSANLLTNGGFEGGLTGWLFHIFDDGQGRATAATDPGVAADGSTAAHLTITSAATANWHIDLEQGGLPFTAGTAYRVQFWARADSQRTITVFSQGGAPNFPNYGLSAQITIGTTWSLYSASFIASSTAKDGRLEFWVGDAAGNVWLDEVTLSDAPPEVYRRNYTNGIVLLNGSVSPQTVSLEAGFKRFTGTQAPLYQYIVDDSDSSFSGTGSWSTVVYNTGAYSTAGSSANLPSKPQNANGPYYHCWQGSCHQLDSATGQAQWNLNIPADGQYTIQVWLPAAPNAASWTKSAVYEIVASGNVVASATIDQTTASAGDAWHAVATVALRAADAPILRIHSGGSGALIADALYITSAALYNDGSAVSQVVLGPMDGILLQRESASCTYTLSSGGLAFGASGGTGAVTITTGASCPWTVSNLPGWVTLTSASTGTGSGTVTFKVFPTGGGSLSGSFMIAGQTYTVEQAAPSIPGLTALGSLGQVAAEGTWDFSLIGINLGASAATARFTFADNNGNPLALPLTFPQQAPAAGPELASTLDRTLNSNAQIVMESSGPDGAAPLVGSGQLSSTGSVSGFGIFSNPKQHWNAVVPLETRNAGKYILAFDNTAPLTTGVAVANLAAQAANVPAIIRDGTGLQIGNSTIPLSALGHTSFMLNDPALGFPVTNGKRGTIEFDTPPGGQISVLGLRANGPALTTLPLLANVGTAGGSITHVAYNGGWTSVFYIVNTGSSSAQFTLSFFDENGVALPVPLLLPQSGTNTTTSSLTRTLAAGEMLVVDTNQQDSPAPVVGSAQLTTTGNVGGFEIFRWNTFNQEASVPLETRTPNSFVLVFDDTNGLTTGVALANQNAAAVNVTARIYDDAGTLLQTASINLGSRGHTSFMLPDNYSVTANKRGMVEFVVQQGVKISAIGLRAKNDGTLTTIPVLTK